MKQKNPLDVVSVAECRACPMLGQDHVPSEGTPAASLMIIGQSPGRREVEQRRPFAGPSGELVDFMLDQARLSRDEIYIANVLKCKPPGNRPALEGESNNCWKKWLYHEIEMVKPRLVLVLGKDAHTRLLPKHIKFGHLNKCSNRKQNRTYLTSYHPAWFLRMNKIEEFVQVGNKVREVGEELDIW